MLNTFSAAVANLGSPVARERYLYGRKRGEEGRIHKPILVMIQVPWNGRKREDMRFIPYTRKCLCTHGRNWLHRHTTRHTAVHS
jgi:hypothetical protein